MVRLKRLGVKYSPPTLIVEYSEAENALKHYSIQLKKLDKQMSAEKIAYKLCARYPAYLDPKLVKTAQVTRLLQRLLAQADDIENTNVSENLQAPNDSTELDLNTVSEFKLQQAKAAMDIHFSKHLITRQDAEYVYDKQQDFSDAVEDSGWDSS